MDTKVRGHDPDFGVQFMCRLHSAMDLLHDPSLLSSARLELNRRLNGRVYESLIAAGIQSPVLFIREIMDRYRLLLKKAKS